MKRAPAATAIAAAALAALGCPGARGPEGPASRPSRASGSGRSVLLLTIDTLRSDHLGAYGYARPTSPRIDALAREGTLFEEAYTYWPKTRGSFVAMLTGRRASQTGYGKTHPLLLDFNPTLASVLSEAGYQTAAIVDNPNVAADLGYAKGFDTYRETWTEKDLKSEMDKTRAITEAGVAFLRAARPERPFFLWLHYVNPHAPYTPPPPYDRAFLDGKAKPGASLPVVASFHGGIPKQWAVPGQDRLAYYVAQYDGEIAAVDQEAGKVLDALAASTVAGSTVVVLTSDHGESLGEHDYYFDHGEDLFDPSLRVPLVVRAPGGAPGRRSGALASTLDVVPTVLDAVKVSYPPDLAGQSLLPAVEGREQPPRPRLHGQNDRNLSATWDERWKLVATPAGDRRKLTLFDRRADPGEEHDVAPTEKDAFREHWLALERFQEGVDAEWTRLRQTLLGISGQERLGPDACARLKTLGYVVSGCQ
jgi:arylsulfatase A-like enzyme